MGRQNKVVTAKEQNEEKRMEKKKKFLNVFKSNITTWSIISIRKVAIKIKLPGQISLRYYSANGYEKYFQKDTCLSQWF